MTTFPGKHMFTILNFARNRRRKFGLLKQEFSIFARVMLFIPTELEIILDVKRDLQLRVDTGPENRMHQFFHISREQENHRLRV